MVLDVPFEGFHQAVEDHLGAVPVYVWPEASGHLLSATSPKRAMLVRSRSRLSAEELRETLTEHGFEVRDGRLSLTDTDETPRTWLAAVAYRSSEKRPGLWIDGFSTPPSPGEAIRALYEEFVADGDVRDITLEEFVRIAEPNVVVVPTDDLLRLSEEKS